MLQQMSQMYEEEEEIQQQAEARVVEEEDWCGPLQLRGNRYLPAYVRGASDTPRCCKGGVYRTVGAGQGNRV
jgi:hypothetical protein